MKDDLIQSRRRLLKTVATAGGVIATGKALPEEWVKPIIDTVLLPAHALVSGCGGDFCGLVETSEDLLVLINITGSSVTALVEFPGTEGLTGTGVCGAGGVFGFTVSFQQVSAFLEGTISPDCTQISGRLCSDPGCSQVIGPYTATPEQCF